VKLLKFFGVLVAAFSLYFFYYWYFGSHTYRYRITVDVEVDGKVQSGSGIWQAQWQQYPWWMITGGSSNWSGTETGEAPVVDLVGHGVLVAIHQPNTRQTKCEITPRLLSYAPEFAVSRTKPGERPAILDVGRDKMFAALAAFKGRYQLAEYELPQFVWLPDRNERLSAKTICPENFSAIHQSVQLKGVFVEMTTAQPDGSVFKSIPWLAQRVLDEQANTALKYWNAEIYEPVVHDILGDQP
jgi:hypothetical protein